MRRELQKRLSTTRALRCVGRAINDTTCASSSLAWRQLRSWWVGHRCTWSKRAAASSSTPTMRIDIDATSLLLRSAGIKNYTYHWIRHLRAAAAGDSVSAFPFLGASSLGNLNHDGSNIGLAGTLWRVAALYAANNLPLM